MAVERLPMAQDLSSPAAPCRGRAPACDRAERGGRAQYGSEYLQRVAAVLSWPVPEVLSESALEALLIPRLPPSRVRRPLPDWAAIDDEMKALGAGRT